MTTSSSIHSNAFNFLSFVETGVDPRTGLYTCSLSLPELQCNDLSGPNLPLRLGYSPLNTTDSGFGKGWTLQLSQYNTRNSVVSLASGETFKVTSTSSGGDGRLLMREQKIETFRLFKIDDKHFRLVHKSGLVEELRTDSNDPVALPAAQYSPQGHRISLEYLPFPGGRMLSSVINADGTQLLGITRQSGAAGDVLVRLHPNTLHEALFRMVIGGSDSRVTGVVLPTANDASWRFGYQDRNGLLCIERVESPLGGSETIGYDPTGHRFPGDEQRILPRVNLHRHSPGSGQPAIETHYSYTPGGNNFLGRNARGLKWEDNDQDNLYKVLDTYTYDTTEELWDTESNSARRRIKRVFNRFHLITEELTEQGDAAKRVVTDYYASDSLPFDQQMPQCQLPKTVTTTFYRRSATAQRRDELVRTEYDVHGNLTLQVQANGISETSEYYPAAGADGCPADPHGFVRHLKQKTVTPASADFGDAPVLRTQHRYLSQPGLSGSAWPWVALESETLSHVNGNNAQLQKTTHSYLNLPGDGLRHGRKSRTAVTLNDKTTFTDFSYDKTIGEHSKLPVLSTVETLTTSFDEVEKSITLEHSLLNGQPTLERDDNDVEIAYTYDQLGRVTLEMVAPGTDFQAERRYDYLLVNNAQMQATQTATDVKKVQTRSVLDGLQRVVSEQRQDVDGNPATKPLRDVYRASYDAFGQLSESTEIDWLGSENLALTSHYTYDDWGEQDSVTGPDGVTEHTQSDPVTLQVETWRDGLGKTVTHNNLFEKPDLVERFDLAGTRFSAYEYFYDGLGRTDHEYDELGRFRAYEYDAFDRMTLSVLPDEAQVERRYALHSREDLPTWIGVNGVVLGEQNFDGLERMYRSVTGGRERTFSFEAGLQQPSSVTTPSGQVIEYGYNQHLGEEPVWRRLQGASAEQGVSAEYDYDPHNARLLSCSGSDQSLTRTYYSTGELKTEQRSNAGQIHDMAYGYSLRGRLLSYTDVFGQQQTYCYDAAGRLKSTTLGETTSRFGYNVSGETSWIVSEDLAEGHSVRIEMEYDDFGRERLRTFTFDDGSVQSLEQHYDARDALKQRILRQGTTLLRDETFLYDLRGRLEDYACSGSELPFDPWGKPIRHQVFTFDALDNLIEVRTEFPGGENLAIHGFDGEDPTQLSSVSNSHADYPALISLEYDADGNLIRDEQGRTLTYDALGRLLNVSEDGSQALQYRYDAQDILSGSAGSEGDEQRFYCDGVLVSQLQGSEQRSFIRGGEHVLAERVSGQDDLLLATDAKKTVLAERDDQTRQSAYSAYGYRSSSVQNKGVLGFDGEYQEYSGVYLLGSYRAYSPALMMFCSPDSWSPFGDGGLNPYAYCLGDPVNMVDPTGHMPWWAGLLAGIGVSILTAGLAAPLGAALGVSAATAGVIGKVATVVSAGATALSVGSGVASEFVEEGPLKDALSWGSFATGIVAGISGGAAIGFRSLSSKLKKTALKGANKKGSWRPGESFGMPDDEFFPLPISGDDLPRHALSRGVYLKTKQPMHAPKPSQGSSSVPGGVGVRSATNHDVTFKPGKTGFSFKVENVRRNPLDEGYNRPY